MKLTEEQLEAFRKLWFIYGNGGKKSTLFNHKLVQGFFEYQENRIEAYEGGKERLIERWGESSPYVKEAVTQECIDACNLVLENKITEAIELAKSKS